MKRLSLAAACCLVAAPALAQVRNSFAEDGPAPSREKPAVEVVEQSSSPLRVSAETEWATRDENGLEVRLVVKNAGERAVRAYVVRVTTLEPEEPGGGCFLHNVERRAKVLRPGRADRRSTWRGIPSEGEQPSFKVLVDFVEFEGGGTWGDDTCRSAEYLEGLRAGARATRAALEERLAADGPEEFLRLVTGPYRGEDWMPAPPEGRSGTWAWGFTWGIGKMRARLRAAAEKGGLPEAEAALRRPFDASEEP